MVASEWGLSEETMPAMQESPGTKKVFREEVRLEKMLVAFGFCSSQEGI